MKSEPMWDFYQFRGRSLLCFSSAAVAAVATFSSCSSLAISSSLGSGRARAVTSISSRVLGLLPCL